MSVARYVWLTAGLTATTLGVALAGFELAGAARTAVVFGAALAALNTVAAYALASRAHRHASVNAFMLLVLGGMGLRLVLMLGAVAAGLWLLALPQTPLVSSVLGHFGLFLVLELTALQLSPRSALEAR